jgi:hypothetical protein
VSLLTSALWAIPEGVDTRQIVRLPLLAPPNADARFLSRDSDPGWQGTGLWRSTVPSVSFVGLRDRRRGRSGQLVTPDHASIVRHEPSDEHGSSRGLAPGRFLVQVKANVGAHEFPAEYDSSVVVAQKTPGHHAFSCPSGQTIFAGIRSFSAVDPAVFPEPSENIPNGAPSQSPDEADSRPLNQVRG